MRFLGVMEIEFIVDHQFLNLVNEGMEGGGEGAVLRLEREGKSSKDFQRRVAMAQSARFTLYTVVPSG